MGTTTINLNLEKPALADKHKLELNNGNLDKIDTAIGSLDDLKTNDKSNIVDAINELEGKQASIDFEEDAGNIKMNGVASVGSLETAARADHIHASDTSKLNTSGGALTGQLTAGGTQDVGVAQVRNIVASTTDLIAGTSALVTGQIHLVYE